MKPILFTTPTKKGRPIGVHKGGRAMNQPTSFEQFVEQASHMQGDEKTLYMNQTDFTPEEDIVADEDTASGLNLQMIRLLASSATHAAYWEEPIYSSGELEQLTIHLDSLKSFTRKAVTLKEMEETNSRLMLKRESIHDEAEPF